MFQGILQGLAEAAAAFEAALRLIRTDAERAHLRRWRAALGYEGS